MQSLSVAYKNLRGNHRNRIPQNKFLRLKTAFDSAKTGLLREGGDIISRTHPRRGPAELQRRPEKVLTEGLRGGAGEGQGRRGLQGGALATTLLPTEHVQK